MNKVEYVKDVNKIYITNQIVSADIWPIYCLPIVRSSTFILSFDEIEPFNSKNCAY